MYSDEFLVGDSRWCLLVYPKGHEDGINKCLSLFLSVSDTESLPDGWKRHTKYCLTVVNQISEKLSERRVDQQWFDEKSPQYGYPEMLPLTKLLKRNSGFMVNEEVKIVAEVGVLEVIEKSEVVEETLLVYESMDVHGFQVLSSQVESVNSLFEKHPDIASELRLKNSHLRTAYLNTLLSLTEILSQSLEEFTAEDLANACCTLTCLTKAGFKLDWLEKRLKEAGHTRLQKVEKDLKQNCEDRIALLEFLDDVV